MTTLATVLATEELRKAGQSPWLDQINRGLLTSGRLKEMIENEGLLGVTSNPSIFEKAINQKNSGYEKEIRRLVREKKNTFQIYDALTIADIQAACDLFLGTFKQSGGEHGFVSLEVLPSLADDEKGTVKEALRLFKAVNRPNVMIKVPATRAGITAIRTLIGQGVNINATLIFSLKHYQEVREAYWAGLETLKASGENLKKVHSVASVFVSRFDTMIDKKLEGMMALATQPQAHQQISNLLGQSALANSKLIYREFKKGLDSDRFKKLQKSGATIQKLLWGSTSVKNPSYPDMMYVEPLIGNETVNTMPQETFEAFLKHGQVSPGSVEENPEDADQVQEKLRGFGIELPQIGQTLQEQGVKAFVDAFNSLMHSLESARDEVTKSGSEVPFISYNLGSGKLADSVDEKLGRMEKENFLQKLLKKDPLLWKSEPAHQAVINNRLGWMTVASWMMGNLYKIDCLVSQIQNEKIKSVVLFGMGGSSLAPEVMSLICRRQAGSPEFHVLDTTDPASVLSIENEIDLKSSLFIVASKSGSTIETRSQFLYFFDKVKKFYGAPSDPEKVGAHFVAITDQGSDLERLAKEKHFRAVLINPGDIGGRYSALSFFGLVPAALIGVDIRGLLRHARDFFTSLEKETNLQHNPGIYLGVLLAQLAKEGKDKLTFLMSKSVEPFGAWLEQLIAESTGKEGKGIIPIDGESPADPSVYGNDRVFVVMKLKKDSAAALKEKVKKLKKAGFPVIEFEWPNPLVLGSEFLRWEIATAVASARLGINPFDEPNVKEAKDCTQRLLEELKKTGKMAGSSEFSTPEQADFSKLYRDLKKKKGYLALLVYGARSVENVRFFNQLRDCLRDHLQVPVLVGFGPRYLHSIGQLYKGGPLKGAFLEVLMRSAKDAAIPSAGYRFGQLIEAQAIGDRQAIESKKLPIVSVDLGKTGSAKLDVLKSLMLERGRQKIR